jgi:hypothetical protein
MIRSYRLQTLVVLSLLLFPMITEAEPHFSGRTGLHCSRCHTSPTGGGKRTPYGALYAMTYLTAGEAAPRRSIERAEEGGWIVTQAATGQVNEWLGVGADLRLANTTTFLEKTANSFDATAGALYVELSPWPERVVLYIDEEVGAGGARNREIWGMIRGPWSTYLRGGRLLPPFGLRLLDDASYTRRVTGVNFTNPDVGAEIGFSRGPIYAAAALTNGTFSGNDTDYYKATWATVELLLDPVRVGLSGAYNPREEGCRTMAGAFGALRLGRLVAQGEADWIGERPADRTRNRHQLVAFAEGDLLLTKGLSLRAGWDFHDANLELRGDRRQRFRFGLDFFPLRMVEAKLSYVIKQTETILPEDGADLLEVLLHVFL